MKDCPADKIMARIEEVLKKYHEIYGSGNDEEIRAALGDLYCGIRKIYLDYN